MGISMQVTSTIMRGLFWIFFQNLFHVRSLEAKKMFIFSIDLGPWSKMSVRVDNSLFAEENLTYIYLRLIM